MNLRGLHSYETTRLPWPARRAPLGPSSGTQQSIQTHRFPQPPPLQQPARGSAADPEWALLLLCSSCSALPPLHAAPAPSAAENAPRPGGLRLRWLSGGQTAGASARSRHVDRMGCAGLAPWQGPSPRDEFDGAELRRLLQSTCANPRARRATRSPRAPAGCAHQHLRLLRKTSPRLAVVSDNGKHRVRPRIPRSTGLPGVGAAAGLVVGATRRKHARSWSRALPRAAARLGHRNHRRRAPFAGRCPARSPGPVTLVVEATPTKRVLREQSGPALRARQRPQSTPSPTSGPIGSPAALRGGLSANHRGPPRRSTRTFAWVRARAR
jgi:hypothetical protein